MDPHHGPDRLRGLHAGTAGLAGQRESHEGDFGILPSALVDPARRHARELLGDGRADPLRADVPQQRHRLRHRNCGSPAGESDGRLRLLPPPFPVPRGDVRPHARRTDGADADDDHPGVLPDAEPRAGRHPGVADPARADQRVRDLLLPPVLQLDPAGAGRGGDAGRCRARLDPVPNADPVVGAGHRGNDDPEFRGDLEQLLRTANLHQDRGAHDAPAGSGHTAGGAERVERGRVRSDHRRGGPGARGLPALPTSVHLQRRDRRGARVRDASVEGLQRLLLRRVWSSLWSHLPMLAVSAAVTAAAATVASMLAGAVGGGLLTPVLLAVHAGPTVMALLRVVQGALVADDPDLRSYLRSLRASALRSTGFALLLATCLVSLRAALEVHARTGSALVL